MVDRHAFLLLQDQMLLACLRNAKNGGGCSVKGSKRNDDDTTTIGERA